MLTVCVVRNLVCSEFWLCDFLRVTVHAFTHPILCVLYGSCKASNVHDLRGKITISKNRYAVTSLFFIWKHRTHFICHLRNILQNFMKNFWRYAEFSKILHWLQWKKSNFSKPGDSQEVLESHNTFFMNCSCYQKKIFTATYKKFHEKLSP